MSKPLIPMKICCTRCLSLKTPKTKSFFKKLESRRARHQTKPKVDE